MVANLSFPGGANLGIWSSIDDLWAVELASKNLDFIILDLEHGFRDFSRFSAAFLSLSGRKKVLVRLRSHEDPWLQSILDLGATELVVPQIEGPNQVEIFIKKISWPPNGSRGFHPRSRVQPPLQGGEESQIRVIPIIEKRSALDSCSEILMVDGVSGVYFGAFDLSVQLELPGPSDSEISTHLASVAEKCKFAGKDFLSMPLNQDQVDLAVAAGAKSFVTGIDIQLLCAGVRQVTGRV